MTEIEEVELLTSDVLGRVRTPASKRETMLDEFERSRITAAQFSKHIGVKATTFGTWVVNRKKSRGEYRGLSPRNKASTSQSKKACAELSLVEAVVEDPANGLALKVTLGEGVEIAVSHSAQIPLVAELAKALRAGGC